MPRRRRDSYEEGHDITQEPLFVDVGSYDTSDGFIDDASISGSPEWAASSPIVVADSQPCDPSSPRGTSEGAQGATRQQPAPGAPPSDRAWTKPVGQRRGKPGSFRIKSRRIFLTYSQAGDGLDPQPLLDDLERLGAHWHLGRERHQDGGTHYHCYVDFGRTFETENARRFDLGTVHPHILVVYRTPWFAHDYAGKDGDIVSSTCDRPPVVRSQAERVADGHYCLAASSRDELFDRIKEVAPWTVLKCFTQIDSYAKRAYRPQPPRAPVTVDRLEFRWRAFPDLAKWVLGSLLDGENRLRRVTAGDPIPDWQFDQWRSEIGPQLVGGRRKSLILWGSTKKGKTDFIRSLGTHFYWRGESSLRILMDLGPENVEYGVLDDLDWTDPLLKGNKFKAWFGAMGDIIATDKYEKKVPLFWDKPVAWLGNDDPFEDIPHRSISWLQQNCIIVHNGDEFVSKRPDEYV
jgi:hypothetical protein